jgi:hypothetical protein
MRSSARALARGLVPARGCSRGSIPADRSVSKMVGMKRLLRSAPLAALLWSAGAVAQQSVPPAPAPPAPASPPSAPSAGATDVREPDAPGAAAPAPADQGPDTLPSLDEEPLPSLDQPPPSSAAPVVAPAAVRPPPPVRAERRLALLGEIGWNGLAGFGAIVSYHVNPHVTFDLGAGLALVGGKLGLRARYNVSEGPVTPFIGAGVLGATGFDAPTSEIGAEDDNSELNIELRPAAFLQTVGGIDWTSRSGFTLVGSVGYAWLVSGDNVVILTGEPTPEEKRALDIVFRSGVVISLALGYSFR